MSIVFKLTFVLIAYPVKFVSSCVAPGRGVGTVSVGRDPQCGPQIKDIKDMDNVLSIKVGWCISKLDSLIISD